jgi:hypothetical protein
MLDDPWEVMTGFAGCPGDRRPETGGEVACVVTVTQELLIKTWQIKTKINRLM